MSSIAAASILKPVLLVGALAAIGMGGYNLATTGCPLGSCDAPEQSTTLTSVSGVDTAASACESACTEGKAVATQLVASDGESAKAEGCSEAMKAACEAMGECPEGMMEHCDDAGDCPMGAGTQTVSIASDEGCSDAMKAACKVMGECPEGMMEHCNDAGDCPMGAAKAAMTADHCEGKDASQCQKACESATDAEQTADAEKVETETSEG